MTDAQMHSFAEQNADDKIEEIEEFDPFADEEDEEDDFEQDDDEEFEVAGDPTVIPDDDTE